MEYGYGAVFVGVFLQNIGLPGPGQTLIVVGGLFAGQGNLDIWGIFWAGVLGAFLGSTIGYTLGFFGGRPFILQYGKFFFINEARLNTLQNFVSRHGMKVLLVARFFVGLRQLSGFLAGLCKMPTVAFLVINFIGAALWVGCIAAGSYYLGKKIDDIYSIFDFFQYYLIAGVLLAVVVFIVRRFTKKGQARE